MRISRLCRATTLFVAGLCALLANTGRAAAPNWAAPNWAAPNWAAPNWAAPNWAAPNWAAPNWAAPNWAAPNWSAGDLTGDWYGLFASESDRTNFGEAALRVDLYEHKPFKGQLALGRLVFDIQGIVTTNPPDPDRGETNPPEPDRQLFIGGATPPEPDMPGARILVRGKIGFAQPPDPDRPPTVVIKAEYLILMEDGSTDMGYLELVPAVRTP